MVKKFESFDNIDVDEISDIFSELELSHDLTISIQEGTINNFQKFVEVIIEFESYPKYEFEKDLYYVIKRSLNSDKSFF